MKNRTYKHHHQWNSVRENMKKEKKKGKAGKNVYKTTNLNMSHIYIYLLNKSQSNSFRKLIFTLRKIHNTTAIRYKRIIGGKIKMRWGKFIEARNGKMYGSYLLT